MIYRSLKNEAGSPNGVVGVLGTNFVVRQTLSTLAFKGFK